MLKRLFRDFRRHREFTLASIEMGLKSDYANSYLGYLWWILDPLLFMGVYVFVVQIVLDRGGPDYPVFVMCSMLFWRWASKSIHESTNSIIRKRSLLSQTYLPKHILPLVSLSVNAVYFLVSILVLLGMLALFRIPLTWHVLEFPAIFAVQFVLLLGMGFWLAHLGALYYDVHVAINFVLRVWFYVSPGLYAVEALPPALQPLLWLNPMSTIYTSSRNVFLYGQSPLYLGLALWTAVGLALILTGALLLYRFDNTYAKML